MRRAMKTCLGSCLVVWTTSMLVATTPVMSQGQSAAAAVTEDGRLRPPASYREWVFLSSGLGMTYGPTQPAAGQPRFFDNVFVNPEAYAAFVRTGRWPDGSIFVLEVRRSAQGASIDNGGQTQGEVVGVEVEVKDSVKFRETGGWAFFNVGTREVTAPLERLPASASCYSCHRDNTAVENTFVQFYPTLFPVAQRFNTVKPTYDPAHKIVPANPN